MHGRSRFRTRGRGFGTGSGSGGALSLASVLASLIAAGESVAYFDPSDTSTLFQDAAGTTPVTADGDPVRRMNAVIGSSAFYAVAPSDASRPLYKTSAGLSWLEVDGTDDWMQVSPTLNLGETWAHVGGWRVDANSTHIFGTSESSNGGILAGSSSTVYFIRNATNTDFSALTAASTLSTAHVATIQQANTSSMSGRINSANSGSTSNVFDDSGVTQGLALFNRRNTIYSLGLNGRFYSGFWGTGTITAKQRTVIEQAMAVKTGVVL